MLADRVEAINGKLYAMGGAWDRMFVPDVKNPTTISFAAVILVPWNATNQQHSVNLSVEDTDGHNVGFTIEVGFNAAGRRGRSRVRRRGLSSLYPLRPSYFRDMAPSS